MNFQSVKTRFIGSYVLLVILFVIQIPIIYVIMGGMGEKYVQEDVAGSLRKRAVEITEILNRQIITGDESLAKVFQAKKAAYDGVIGSLRTGSENMAAITDPDILVKLETVEQRWETMRAELDSAQEAGGELTGHREVVRDTTFPMVAKLNKVIAAEVAFDDPNISKYINVSGLQRMRTVKLSYLLERYLVSYEDKAQAAKEIKETASDFEGTLTELKSVALGTVIRGVKGKEFNDAVIEVDELWQKRQAAMFNAMNASDLYRNKSLELASTHTPEVVALADALTKSFISKAQDSAMTGVLIMAVAVLISALLAIFFMISANSTIIKPISKIMETLKDYANGDLTKRTGITIKFLGREIKDEVSELAESADAMAENMSDMIGKIVDSSSHLASASEQLSASSTQISEGANRQSDQTTMVATAMEEMNATVIEVAKNSQSVSESARNAQETALSGGNVVKQAKEAMQDVKESTSITGETITRLGTSSEQIGSIISVINDIADQTNLLALNAAIEAARAGEQGRGFAVVADEVRKLAERTTVSTKEISEMIKSIQNEASAAVETMNESAEKVENGVNLVNEAGTSLENIVSGINNVTDLVNQIATATEEQSATTDEITANMEAITQVSSSNLTAVTEVTGATNDLATLATGLKDLVSGFKVSSKAAHEAVVYSKAAAFGERAGEEAEALEGPKSKVISMQAGA